MKREDFNNLLGKSRHEIKGEIGDGFNYFMNPVWTYEVERTWFGRRTILMVTFDDEVVSEIDLLKTFRRY
ncbi:hypothetical protein D1631_09940 [Chryseobacterium nematophagum]|uniref:Uncharacterized protein n=1 Tax=Chryseobacterium nematophagum TaxID=2305228 RepID=A0A3M7TJ47_9FLAO|nr:hypothetical protein [Chryseobacterium nematophagum]RNA62230.1 hypothetical protein D1631_09940 [Chryseobacterium nematophagum]